MLIVGIHSHGVHSAYFPANQKAITISFIMSQTLVITQLSSLGGILYSVLTQYFTSIKTIKNHNKNDFTFLILTL